MDVPFGKKLRIPFNFLDAGGAPANVDGTPGVVSTLGTVEVSGANDSWAALIDPQAVGPFSVSVTADADLGAGVVPLAASLGDHMALASPQASSVNVGTPTIV